VQDQLAAAARKRLRLAQAHLALGPRGCEGRGSAALFEGRNCEMGRVSVTSSWDWEPSVATRHFDILDPPELKSDATSGRDGWVYQPDGQPAPRQHSQLPSFSAMPALPRNLEVVHLSSLSSLRQTAAATLVLGFRA
jgi:hypothetical protein